MFGIVECLFRTSSPYVYIKYNTIKKVQYLKNN